MPCRARFATTRRIESEQYASAVLLGLVWSRDVDHLCSKPHSAAKLRLDAAP